MGPSSTWPTSQPGHQLRRGRVLALPRLVGPARRAPGDRHAGRASAPTRPLRLGLINRLLPAARLEDAARALPSAASGPTLGYGPLRAACCAPG